jgi:thymidylate kinase
MGGIIVEGADQSGKSTFCEKLQELTNMPIIHFGIPKPGTDLDTEYIKDIPQNDYNPIIFDRSYLSELVYGDLFRKGAGISFAGKRKIEEFLRSCNYIMVLCRRKNYQWKDRPEEDYTEEDNLRVIRKYDDMFEFVGIPKIIVDPFDSDAASQVLDFWIRNNEQIDARS